MSASNEENPLSTHHQPERKLVTLRRITSLRPINRSRWEVAAVDGWNVVISKGQCKVGEIVVYFEIDSFLPISDERFWEYTAAHANQYYQGARGYVVRTLMRLDHISQGLIFPLNLFPEVNIDKREELKRSLQSSPDSLDQALMELDYSKMLKVKKYELQYFEDVDTLIYGPSPIFFPQPGCERAQNVLNLFSRYADTNFLVTEKSDGVPATIYSVDVGSQWYKALPRRHDSTVPRPGFGICGRWTDYVEEQASLLWKAVRQQGIIEKLPQIGASCTTSDGRKVTVTLLFRASSAEEQF